MKKNIDISKIWQIMGNIEGCQEMLNQAIKSKDWQTVANVSDYLDKVKDRLDKLTEDE